MSRLLILPLLIGSTACGGQPWTVTSAFESSAAAAASVNRSGLPPAGPDPAWAPPAVETWTLRNGLKVWYLKQDQVPLISIDLVLPRGSTADPAGQAGLTSMMIDMLDEGAGDRSSLELGEALQRLATGYSAQATTDGVILGMNLLADKLEPSLAIFADIVLRPRFPEEEWARRKEQRLAALLQQEANPSYGRQIVMRQALYGEGYGGRPPGGTRRTVEPLTLDAVRARYQQVFVPSGGHLIVVGAVDREAARAALEKHFGGWTGTSDEQPAPITAAPDSPDIYFVDYPGSAQSAIVFARRCQGRGAPDYFEALVLNRAIGGAFTSRLNLNLREDKGYTYGARSHFNRWRRAGFWALGARVKAETTRASIDEIIKELEGARGARPLTAEEHRQAIEGMKLGFPARFESLSAVSGKLTDLPIHGLPADWYTQWPARLSTVTLAAANAVGAREADPAAFLIVVAGDREAVAPSLEGLGRKIRYFDAQGRPVE